jgi:hypothetical protein
MRLSLGHSEDGLVAMPSLVVDVIFPSSWNVIDPTDMDARSKISSSVGEAVAQLRDREAIGPGPTTSELAALVDLIFDRLDGAGILRAAIWSKLAKSHGKPVLLSAWATLAIVSAALTDGEAIGELWQTFVDPIGGADLGQLDATVYCDEVDLPAGRALRVVRYQSHTGRRTVGGGAGTNYSVTYLLPVCQGRAVALLTCMTTSEGDRRVFDTAFASIADSLKVTDDVQPIDESISDGGSR